jgi:hypothetical protein
MPRIRGTHSEVESYSFMDIVALNGCSFIARADDPGPCPGDGWQLIASAGKPGKPGPKGDRGERGTTTIVTSRFRGWKVDRENYTVIPINDDGSDGEPLPLRGLFEQYDGER